MKVVAVNNIYKSFGDNIALNNLSLGIEEGEIFGLLGPNGAGKSTTINILSGLLNQDKGDISIFNKNIRMHLNEIKQNMGVVPQDLAIFEELTAYENISFFASLYGIQAKERNKKTIEALAFVGLEEKAKEKVKSFSGGMKRRLNIACGIAHKPRLIIMDEPTIGIDPQSRNHILNSIKVLNQKGASIIYTTHYMEEAEALCDRMAIIDKGCVIASGTAESLRDIISDKNTVFIGLRDISKVDESILLNIKGVEDIYFKDGVLQVVSKKEVICLDKVIAYLAEAGASIMDVKTKSPNLEDVFLNLTGRSLRD
ncbi:ABC transporter ATP-binding protein [Cellulosilyticum sp. I15G10I2]|uniref:ABC transporter ATP-binding protein n=1 Tax=Cellulosilyticum sp. I15G10I2 TaxID=1892843 RepID=UPI00085BF72E|nr:ABC transporter ATP-binding protein [Cellulosilyticum sp. I15G10I2]